MCVFSAKAFVTLRKKVMVINTALKPKIPQIRNRVGSLLDPWERACVLCAVCLFKLSVEFYLRSKVNIL